MFGDIPNSYSNFGDIIVNEETEVGYGETLKTLLRLGLKYNVKPKQMLKQRNKLHLRLLKKTKKTFIRRIKKNRGSAC